MGKIKWDYQHTLLALGAGVSGALVGYLNQQSATTLVEAFSSWTQARPILVGALVAVLGSLITMAKQSFVQVTPQNQDSARKDLEK